MFVHFRSEKKFKVFDVRNNGLKWGGKLEVQLNRHLVLGNNDRIHVTKSKAIQRRFLDDIHLHIGISVRP